MTVEAWITVGTVVAMVLAMARDLSPDMVMMAGLATLMAAGVLSPEEAFVGFSNPAIVTIAALFVVAEGVKRTGGLDAVARYVLGKPRHHVGAQLRMMVPVAGLSAFLNNTPVVALFIPLVQDWTRRNGLRESMFLMPLSYAAILGGTCTLIGTSTNLVVAGMVEARNPELSIGMFDITWLGVPVLFAGLFGTVGLSRLLLQEREPSTGKDAREYTVSLRVAKGSPLIGQTIGESLRGMEKLYVYELERGDTLFPAVGPHLRIEQDDVLRFTGMIDEAAELSKMRLVPEIHDEEDDDGDRVPEEDRPHRPEDGERHPRRRWVQAVIANQSSLAGKTVKTCGFRTRFKAAIVAVHRHGERIGGKIGEIELRPADLLILETYPRFTADHAHDPNFALVADIDGSTAPRHDRAWIAMTILVGMVLVNALGLMHLSVAALLAAGLMLATRCMTGNQARGSLNLKVLIAVASALGIGVALDESGAAAAIGTTIVEHGSPFGPVGLLAAVYVATALLAGVVSTTASAALMFPIAASAADQVEGLGVVPMALVVMIAASTALSTPVGYQTNLMVSTIGGYRYADFLRLGLPLQAIVGAVAITMTWLIYL